VLCNGSMRKLLGLEPDRDVPPVSELFHQREIQEVVVAARRGTPAGGCEAELNGRAVLVTARPLPDGGVVMGFLDVSDVRRVQLVRRDFVANVSHELKTPLTSILGYAETLLNEEEGSSVHRNFLNVIVGNARRMQFLVDDLLDLARVESGAWTPRAEPLDVESIAREAWRAVAGRPGGVACAFTVSVGEDVRLVADREAFGHVLSNLLDNARRHTSPDGSVAVRAVVAAGGVEVVVEDNGSGIPSEHVPRVFERFYRVDPGRSREEGGTGLGLAIVKHLCEGQGARVTLESTLGVGTTARLWFPAVVPTSASAAGTPS